MLQYRIPGYSGFAAKYSSFYDNKIAVAASANYGLAGNGKLLILSIQPNGSITADVQFDTQDGLFDLAWSETHANQVVTANGDGSVKLFDAKVGKYPVAMWHEHPKEVFSVNWNLVNKQNFITLSWDGTIKLWTPALKKSLITLSSGSGSQLKPSLVPNSKTGPAQPVNEACVYQAKFSPHDPNLIASVTASSRLQIWDIRSQRPLQLDIIAHNGLEALGLDFNKYRSSVLATSGVDKSVRIWDLRMISNPFPGVSDGGATPQNELMGHQFAVRNVVWSPHNGSELLSCSYDMTARIWHDTTDPKANYSRRINHSGSCSKVFNNHTEFVIGGDWSLWGEPGWVVTTGWDEMVYIWNAYK